MIKINNFRGDLSNISAKTATLVLGWNEAVFGSLTRDPPQGAAKRISTKNPIFLQIPKNFPTSRSDL